MINNNFRELQQQLSQAGKQKRDEPRGNQTCGQETITNALNPR